MSDFDQLTNESKYLLAEFMKKFYSNVENGQSRPQAKRVALTLDEVEELLPLAKRDDLKDYVYELSQAGFLTHADGNNEPVLITLTNKAIAWSQNKLGNDIKKWAKFASSLFMLIKP